MAEVTGTSWNVYDANTMTAKEIYGRVLAELGKTNEKIVGLSADLSKSTNIGNFEKAFPKRFVNVGIAEQNLFGVAAGMAKSGLIPFASTFGAFASMRAIEQLRTDICYQRLNVKVIATHSGVSFGSAGTTHHVTEDLSILRAIANLTVIVPADGIETANAVKACLDINGPVYIRIGRGFEPPFYEAENYGFKIGKGVEVHGGSDVAIITCGVCVLQAVMAAKFLQKEGISVRVINMHTIKPIDKDIVLKAVLDTRRVITVEEHNVIGGLGDAVASVIAESGKGCAFKKVGIPDEFSVIGYPEDLYAHYKLDADGIADSVREVMKREFEEDENWDDEV